MTLWISSFLKKLAECVNSALFKTRQQLAGRKVEDAERVNAFLDNVFMYIDENKAFLPLIRDRVSSCYRLMLKGREAELKEAYDSLVKLFLRHGFTEYESEMNIYMLVSMLAPVSCDSAIQGEPYKLDEIKSGMQRLTNKLLA